MYNNTPQMVDSNIGPYLLTTTASSTYLPLSGGTMKSNIVMPYPVIECNSVNISTAPSAEVYNTVVYFRDKNDKELGAIHAIQKTDKTIGVQLETSPTFSGTRYINNIRLFVSPSGTPSVTVTSPAAWRKALELEPGTQIVQVIARYPASGNATIAAGSTTMNVTVPSGYKIIGYGNLQSQNFVRNGGYVLTDIFGKSGTVSIGVWLHEGGTGFLTLPIWCMKAD